LGGFLTRFGPPFQFYILWHMSFTDSLSAKSAIQVIDTASYFRPHARPRLVNSKLARIFKGILESWKSTQNEKRFAKSGGQKIWGSGVYQARIYHDSPLREIHGPLMPAQSAPTVPLPHLGGRSAD
jgi:hypothetical protein